MRVKLQGANKCKKEKTQLNYISVELNITYAVCSLAQSAWSALRFGETDSLYSNVTCTVRDIECTKSTQTNKIKHFLKGNGT